MNNTHLLQTWLKNTQDLVLLVTPGGIIKDCSGSVNSILNSNTVSVKGRKVEDISIPPLSLSLLKGGTKPHIQRFRFKGDVNDAWYEAYLWENSSEMADVHVINCRKIHPESYPSESPGEQAAEAKKPLVGSDKKAISNYSKVSGRAESRDDLPFLAEAIPHIVWTTDSRGRLTYLNHKWHEYTGIPEDICDEDKIKVIHSDDLKKVRLKWLRALKTTSAFETEYRLKEKSGSYRWHLGRAIPIKDNGKVLKWLGTSTDIHDIKPAEETLKYNVNRFHSAFEQAAVGIGLGNEKGECCRINNRYANILGHTREDLKKAPLSRIIHPDDREKYNKYLKKLLDRKVNEYSIEFRCIHKDGSIVEVKTYMSGVWKRSGEFDYWISVAEDISQRKKTEQLLQEKATVFQAITEMIPQVVWEALPDGKTIYFNQRWYDYTKLSEKDSLKNGWLKTLHPDDSEQTLRIWKESIKTEKPYNIEYRLKRFDGKYRWFLGRALPLKDKKGKIYRWFGTCTNIQEQKMQNQELYRKNKELIRINTDLDNFIYTASHDLKAPIANLEALFREMHNSLNRYYSKDEKIMSEMISSSIYKFQNTIHDLTNVARIQKEFQEERKQINIHEVYNDVLADFQKTIEETEVDITTSFKVTELFFSKRNLRSIIYNLLSNALKFSHPDRKLRIIIKTYKKGKYNIFSMKDNGIGFSMDKKEKIFSMFRSLHRDKDGSGVGLYIVKRNVENAGGSIDVQSKPGKGSEFRVMIPLNGAQNMLPFSSPEL